MGLITSIRKRLWIVTIIIALALIGFVVMDMTSGQNGMNNQNTVGKVNGEVLDWKEFQNNERILYANSQVDYFGRKEYMWHQFVEKAILETDAKKNGTGVSDGELKELEFGYNLSPVVERNFKDPNTGQINREQLNQFKQGMEDESLDPRLLEFWKVQEKEIIKDRLYTKISTIAVKALFMPTFMLERNQYESNEKLDFEFGRVSYDLIKDEEVEVTDKDIEDYVRSRKAKYENKEESRTIKYLVFDILPTPEDSATTFKNVESKISVLKESKNDSAFVTTNLGIWDETYFTKNNISPALKDTIYSFKIGDVYGPYIDDGEYKIAKVIDKKLMPDSVRSRHILRKVSTREEYVVALRMMDSLKNVIEKGLAPFDSIAIQYSQDGSALKGGDLGFVSAGTMVKPFNDYIFYQAKKGELKIILTQFGLHLVQVTDYKFIQNNTGVHLAIIGEAIVPGDNISRSLEDEALNLAQQNRNLESLKKAIEGNPKYKLETAGNLLVNDYVIKALGEKATNTGRDIVRWAFNPETKAGDVSAEIYTTQDEVRKYTNKYIVAALSSISPKGLPSVEFLRELVEGNVRKELKFNKIKEGIGQVTELTSQLGSYSVTIDTAIGASVAIGSVPKLGNEPRIVAAARKLENGQISGPLRGEAGVYVIKMLNKQKPEPSNNMAAFRQFYYHPAKNTAMSHLMEGLKKNANIKDNRSKFF